MAYLTSGQHAGGCVGAMSYYTASGEPPGQWAGKGAAALGLTGRVDPAVIGRLYQQNIGPGGELLVKRRQSRAAWLTPKAQAARPQARIWLPAGITLECGFPALSGPVAGRWP